MRHVAKHEDLRGKRVIVTAASGGIGRAIALGFAVQGARVVVTGRSAARLQPVVDEIARLGGEGYLVENDLHKKETWGRCMQESLELLGGGLDVLVNNGPGLPASSFDTDSADAYEAYFQVNVAAAASLINDALPALRESKGCIINMSSALSLSPAVKFSSAYCVAKAALDAFTKVKALKLAPEGIRVNAVNPGFIPTVAVSSFAEQLGREATDFAVAHPMGRLGEAEEVASAVVFLASEAASFITGVLLPIDGGLSTSSWTCKLPV